MYVQHSRTTSSKSSFQGPMRPMRNVSCPSYGWMFPKKWHNMAYVVILPYFVTWHFPPEQPDPKRGRGAFCEASVDEFLPNLERPGTHVYVHLCPSTRLFIIHIYLSVYLSISISLSIYIYSCHLRIYM